MAAVSFSESYSLAPCSLETSLLSGEIFVFGSAFQDFASPLDLSSCFLNSYLALAKYF